MFGKKKKSSNSSKQVLRLDANYFDMSYEDSIEYLRMIVETMSPNPEVRAKAIAKLNALAVEAKDQI